MGIIESGDMNNLFHNRSRDSGVQDVHPMLSIRAKARESKKVVILGIRIKVFVFR